MYTWHCQKVKKVSFSRPVLLVGFPGVGSVGKLTIDFLIERLDAVKIFSITSSAFPHCALVTDKGLALLPQWEVFCAKVGKQSVLLVTGDAQPEESSACYFACEKLLDLSLGWGCKEIITLGGLAVEEVPEKPVLHLVATESSLLLKLPKSPTVFRGDVTAGPIIGVAGVLLAMAAQKKVAGLCVLAETLPDPEHFGIGGARSILSFLRAHLGLALRIQELDRDLASIEHDVREKLAQLEEYSAERGKELLRELSPYIG